MGMLSAIELVKRYRNGVGVGPISYEFHPGVTGLVGPNGSGKTTLLKALAGFERSDMGEALFDGVPTAEMPMRELGFLFEEPTAPPKMTALEYLEFDALMRGYSPDEIDLVAAAARFDCADYLNQRMGSLSQGMAKRVYLSAAFLGNPSLLMLDEPLNALDIQTTLLLKDEIAERRKNDFVTIVSSHVLSLLDEVADRVVFLSNGLFKSEHAAIDTERTYRKVFLDEDGTKPSTSINRSSVPKPCSFQANVSTAFLNGKGALPNPSRGRNNVAWNHVVICEEISKTFGEKKALRNVTFSVPAGRVVGLLGENGAGKSTLLRILCGALSEDSGLVRYDGAEVDAQSRRTSSAILFGGETGLYQELTGEENIRYFGQLRGMKRGDIEARMAALVERFGARSFLGKRVEDMSTGMRQRIAIIRSVIHDPNIVLFDEPDAGLDFNAARVVDDFLRGSAHDGKIVIVSSHSIGDIMSTCDAIVVLSHGNLIAEHTIDEITQGRTTQEAYDFLFDLVSNGSLSCGI